MLPSVENILSWRSLAARRAAPARAAHRRAAPHRAARRRRARFTSPACRLGPRRPGERGFSDWLFDQREIDDTRRRRSNGATSSAARRRSRSRRSTCASTTRRASMPRPYGAPARSLGSQRSSCAPQLTGGDVDASGAWNGRVYARARLHRSRGLAPWLDYPVDVSSSGHGALRAWANDTDGEVREATADLALTNVRGEACSGPAAARARRPQRAPAWRAARRAATAQRKRSAARAARRRALHAGRLPARLEAAGGVAERQCARARAARASGRSAAAAGGAAPARVELEPRGQLADAALRMAGRRSRRRRATAVRRASPIWRSSRARRCRASPASPARVEASDAGGRVSLDSRGAELELPRVFPQPRLSFDALAGELDWRREGARLQVEIPSLTFANADSAAMPSAPTRCDGERTGRDRPLGGASRAPTRSSLAALPAARRADGRQDARLAGAGNRRRRGERRASCACKATCASFPFVDPAQGEFRVTARVRNGAARLRAGWPRIEDDRRRAAASSATAWTSPPRAGHPWARACAR